MLDCRRWSVRLGVGSRIYHSGDSEYSTYSAVDKINNSITRIRC
jgi:hypothetical protein